MITVGGLNQAVALRATMNPCFRQRPHPVINLLSMVGDTTSQGEGDKAIGKFPDNCVDD